VLNFYLNFATEDAKLQSKNLAEVPRQRKERHSSKMDTIERYSVQEESNLETEILLKNCSKATARQTKMQTRDLMSFDNENYISESSDECSARYVSHSYEIDLERPIISDQHLE